MLVIPPPPLIKVVNNTRPCSKLGGTTLNGGEEGGERFEVKKVCFTLYCLTIFATVAAIISLSWEMIIMIMVMTIMMMLTPDADPENPERGGNIDTIYFSENSLKIIRKIS